VTDPRLESWWCVFVAALALACLALLIYVCVVLI
jgi:hypothetical protein